MDIAELYVEGEKLEQERKKTIEDFIVLSNDFIIGLDFVRSMAEISPSFRLEALGFRLADDLLESTIVATSSVKHGAVNPAKRELRYILEQCVKYAFVDQQMRHCAIKQKMHYLNFRKVEFIDSARGLSLFLSNYTRTSLLNELPHLYGRLSEYVHPSFSQSRERIERYRTRHYIGRYTAADIREVTSIAERVFDISLLYFCHTLGSNLVKGVVKWFDESVGWSFHHTLYMREFWGMHINAFEAPQTTIVAGYIRDLILLLEGKLSNDVGSS